jgi:hypothetical protein
MRSLVSWLWRLPARRKPPRSRSRTPSATTWCCSAPRRPWSGGETWRPPRHLSEGPGPRAEVPAPIISRSPPLNPTCSGPGHSTYTIGMHLTMKVPWCAPGSASRILIRERAQVRRARHNDHHNVQGRRPQVDGGVGRRLAAAAASAEGEQGTADDQLQERCGQRHARRRALRGRVPLVRAPAAASSPGPPRPPPPCPGARGPPFRRPPPPPFVNCSA